MGNYAESVSLQYGDAEISFYNIKLTPKESAVSMVWHSHRYYELHFVEVGNVKYLLRNREIIVSAGEMVIIPPETEHYSVFDKDTTSNRVISMSVAQIDGSQRFYSSLTEALDTHSLQVVNFGYDELKPFGYTELYRSVLGVLKLKQVASDFTHRLFSLLLSNNNPTIASGKASAVLIDNLVNRDGTTLDEIAEATNYSKRHITRLIKKTYGKTFSELKRKAKENTL